MGELDQALDSLARGVDGRVRTQQFRLNFNHLFTFLFGRDSRRVTVCRNCSIGPPIAIAAVRVRQPLFKCPTSDKSCY